MAIYKFSSFGSATTTLFDGSTASGHNALFTTADSFIVDPETATPSVSSSASSAVITDISGAAISSDTTGGGASTDTKIVVGGKTFSFTGFAPTKISTTNFTFADGSKLIIGDGTAATTLDDSANTLVGTDYNDYMDGLGGSDTVSYAAASAGVTVNLTVTTAQDTGGAGTDKLLNIENVIGSAYNDTLTGIAGTAAVGVIGSTLDGGLGIDTLTGGLNDDTYIVTAGDIINDPVSTVTGAGGNDTVKSSADWALGGGLENLTLLTGATVGIGNGSNNYITGNIGNNVLDAGSGGIDTLDGGDGNDTYIVRATGTKVIENNPSATQIDTVQDYFAGALSLSANVENLRLMAAGASVTGNGLSNIIYASTGAETIDGGLGVDTLSYQYGAGASGSGGVTLVLSGSTAATASGGSGADSVKNIENLIGSNYSDDLKGDANVNKLQGMAGNDILRGGGNNDTLDGGAGDDTYYVNGTGYTLVDLAGTDTVVASVSFSIASFTSIENITTNSATAATITGTGNALANTLTGNTTGQTDSLVGGAGDDTYIIKETTDVVNETVTGSGGTDTIILSAATSSAFTLPTNVERLTLTSSATQGTGNSLDNVITGNTSTASTLVGGSGNDVLIGGNVGDTLDGGVGNDVMKGGKGSDNYFVNATSDVVTENAGTIEGTADTVVATIPVVGTVVANYVLGANVENLTLGTLGAGGAIVTSGITQMNGTGNSVNNTLTGNDGDNSLTGGAGNDTLVGNSGTNTLDGGTGHDTMTGGSGNDTYIVDDTGDRVNADTGGTDTVKTGVTYSLMTATSATTPAEATGIENLILTGTGNINGTGNNTNNVLTGNSGSNTLTADTSSSVASQDTLNGGGGKDLLVGGQDTDTGSGSSLVLSGDTFVFSKAADTTVSAFDVITNFTTGSDKIDISGVFGLTPAAFSTAITVLGTAFTTGGSGNPELIAVESGGNTLVSGDVDGNGTADFAIQLLGIDTPTGNAAVISDFK